MIFKNQLSCVALGLQISLCISCVQNASDQPNTNDAHANLICPVYDSRNWRAWIDQADRSAGSGRLNVSGQLDLPSPGYSIDYTRGTLDRRNPPSLTVHLSLNPPEDAVIQVVHTEKLQLSFDTEVLQYHSLVLMCGDRELAEIVEVTLTE